MRYIAWSGIPQAKNVHVAICVCTRDRMCVAASARHQVSSRHRPQEMNVSALCYMLCGLQRSQNYQTAVLSSYAIRTQVGRNQAICEHEEISTVVLLTYFQNSLKIERKAVECRWHKRQSCI